MYKMYVKMFKIYMFKMDIHIFGHSYRVATLTTLNPTVSGIIILRYYNILN